MNFNKGMSPNKCKFPITEEQLNNLKPCNLVNPMVGKHHGTKIPKSFDIRESALEILKVRQQVQNRDFPWWFMKKYWPYNFEMPKHLPVSFQINNLSFDNVEGLAEIVHMDDPLDLPLSQKKVLTNPKYGGKANIKRKHGNWKQFIETVPDLNKKISIYQSHYIRKIFEAKSYFGIARPEEVLSDILTPHELTAYFEGCPNHASTPQGHGGFSQAGILALNDSLTLTTKQIQELLYESYLWGQFRCLAGVHYGIDIILSILIVGGFEEYLDKNKIASYSL